MYECPNGLVPNGNACDPKLVQSSSVYTGVSIALGLLCAGSIALWLALTLCFTVKNRQSRVKNARMRALRQMSL